MITSRRITDNPLGFLKDDLLLALRRIQIDLDACDEGPADSAALEAMIDAIDQVRNPLAALEHRDAVALLDEMRATVLKGMHNGLLLLEPALLRQAVQQLTVYLETYLSPGNRQANAGGLMETAVALRQARQQDAEAPAAEPMESPMGLRDLRDLLERLQRTVAEKVEKAADEAASWEALQGDLSILRQLIAERGWNRATRILERLNRIVSALATGGAEHYGVLVSGVCAEILASLSYSLESLDNGVPASSTVLSNTEAQLAQLDTLLGLPAELGAAPKPPPCATPAMDMDMAIDLVLPNFPEFDASAAALSRPLSVSVKSVLIADSDLLDFAPTSLNPSTGETPPAVRDTVDLASLEESIEETSTVIPWKTPGLVSPPPEEPRETVGTSPEDLINLLGLGDTDLEFAEVFLEEACGELAAIREQLTFWRSDLTDHEALTAIRRAFHTLKGSGRMVGAMVIGDFAWEFERLLNQVLDGSLPVSLEIIDVVAAAVEALSPLVGATPLRGGELETLAALAVRTQALPQSLLAAPESAPAATPERREPVVEAEPRTMPFARVIAPDMDAEFVEVFLEEAHGELAVIREQLTVWRANFEDRHAMTTLRRAFHTLKGSGRVVGATAIGDFAWCFENLLNHLLNGTVVAAPAIADLLDEATTALEALLGEDAIADEALTQLPGLTARAEAWSQALPAVTLPSVEALEAEAPIKPVAIEAPTPEALPVEGVIPVETAIPEPVMTPSIEPVIAPSIDVELVQVFQYEAAEILDASDAILQQLGAEPDHTGLLNDLRRGMHTLKGSSRMAGIMTVGDLAHAAESVLDALGKGLSQATPAVLDTLQHTLDRLNQMLAEAASGVNPAAATDLIHDLHRLADRVTAGEGAETRPVGVPEPAAVIAEPTSLRTMTELDQELVQVFQIEASEILDSSDTLLQRWRDRTGQRRIAE